MNIYFPADLNMKVILSTNYRHLLQGITLDDVEGHFIVVVGFTDHKMAVLGYWQPWCGTRHDGKAIMNLSHPVPFYYVILLLHNF